jgi:hypothetical protein
MQKAVGLYSHGAFDAPPPSLVSGDKHDDKHQDQKK